MAQDGSQVDSVEQAQSIAVAASAESCPARRNRARPRGRCEPGRSLHLAGALLRPGSRPRLPLRAAWASPVRPAADHPARRASPAGSRGMPTSGRAWRAQPGRRCAPRSPCRPQPARRPAGRRRRRRTHRRSSRPASSARRRTACRRAAPAPGASGRSPSAPPRWRGRSPIAAAPSRAVLSPASKSSFAYSRAARGA